MFFLIIGLGNPGQAYQGSRHNAGFAVVDRLAQRAGLRLREGRFEALWAQGRLVGQQVCLLKPQTYMNLSGRSVRPATEFFQVSAERIMVIHDDIDLELGRIQIRRGGGDGGHRGIRSLMEHLEYADFVRVRLGVGRPADGSETSDHVLEEIAPADQKSFGDMLERAEQAVQTWLNHDLATAMNRFNPWKKKKKKKSRSDSDHPSQEEERTEQEAAQTQTEKDLPAPKRE